MAAGMISPVALVLYCRCSARPCWPCFTPGESVLHRRHHAVRDRCAHLRDLPTHLDVVGQENYFRIGAHRVDASGVGAFRCARAVCWTGPDRWDRLRLRRDRGDGRQRGVLFRLSRGLAAHDVRINSLSRSWQTFWAARSGSSNSLGFSILFLLLLSLVGKKLKPKLLLTCTANVCGVLTRRQGTEGM